MENLPLRIVILFLWLALLSPSLAEGAHAGLDVAPATTTQSSEQEPTPPDPEPGFWYVGVIEVDDIPYWRYENAEGRVHLVPIPDPRC